jgi:hypothetical protein
LKNITAKTYKNREKFQNCHRNFAVCGTLIILYLFFAVPVNSFFAFILRKLRQIYAVFSRQGSAVRYACGFYAKILCGEYIPAETANNN